jgi:O-antigen/teichoic acid export membrane protein
VVLLVVVIWVVAICVAVVSIRILRAIGAKPKLLRRHSRRLLSYVVFTALTALGGVLFSSIDRLVVGVTLGVSSAAYYSIVIGIANKLLFLADVAARPLLPAASALVAIGRCDAVRRQLVRATRGAAVVSVLVAIAALVLSGPVLRAWMGADFSLHALGTLRILVVVYAIAAIAAPGFHVANGIGLAWFSGLSAIVSGAATIGLIVWLGRSWGLEGTAWANGAYCINLVIPLAALLTLKRLQLREVPEASRDPLRGATVVEHLKR